MGWPGVVGVLALVLGLLAAPLAAEAQTPGNVHRVGIIHVSGHHHVVVDGLRQRLRELGLEEGKHLVLDIREIQGDLKAAEEAARNLERGNVEAIHFCISCSDCNSKSVLCLCTRI